MNLSSTAPLPETPSPRRLPGQTQLPQLSPHHGAVTLQIHRGVAEPEEIERLRYRIYVDELEYAEPRADHFARRLADPMDESGLHVTAWIDGELVGATRSHPLALAPEAMRRAMAPAFATERDQAETFYVSRMVIAPQHRRSGILMWLGREMVLQESANGYRRATLASWDHLRGIYWRLGFRPCAPSFCHPLYGRLLPMELPLDLDTLAARRSPLVLGLRGTSL